MNFTHFFTIVLCVIDGQKPLYGLTAASTLTAIVIKYLLSKFSVKPLEGSKAPCSVLGGVIDATIPATDINGKITISTVP